MISKQAYKTSESGNILFIVLVTIVLIGIVTAAVRSGGSDGGSIDKENLTIRVSNVQQYAGDIERAVTFVLANDASESDIRFAHPDAHADYGDYNTNAAFQVFHPDGGGAEYQSPPSGVNDGSAWEFYGNTHLPQVGTPAQAELIAVLPNVTKAFCDKVNALNNYNEATQPVDTGACLNAGVTKRFDEGTQFEASGSVNTVDEATFTHKPSTQGCAECGASSGNYHFFHVLLSR